MKSLLYSPYPLLYQSILHVLIPTKRFSSIVFWDIFFEFYHIEIYTGRFNASIFDFFVSTFQNKTEDKSGNKTEEVKPKKPVIVKEDITFKGKFLDVGAIDKKAFEASVKK